MSAENEDSLQQMVRGVAEEGRRRRARQRGVDYDLVEMATAQTALRYALQHSASYTSEQIRFVYPIPTKKDVLHKGCKEEVKSFSVLAPNLDENACVLWFGKEERPSLRVELETIREGVAVVRVFNGSTLDKFDGNLCQIGLYQKVPLRNSTMDLWKMYTFGKTDGKWQRCDNSDRIGKPGDAFPSVRKGLANLFGK